MLIAIAVSGCAGTDAQLRSLEQSNALRIDQISDKPYDYTVRLISAWDFGYDTSIKETRDDTALRALRAQCPAAKVIGEDTIQKPGMGPDYILQIKCDGQVEAPSPKARRKDSPSRS